LESRLDFIKNKYKDKLNTEHDTMATHKDPEAIVSHFAEHGDPTKKKIYTDWIVNQYHKGAFRQEDTPRIHEYLSDFEKYKSKLPEKDINKYGSLKDVGEALKPHMGAPATNKEQKEFENNAGHELKYEDDRIKIYHLKSKEASQNLYGGGVKAGNTDWCTAARSDDCRFDHYNSKGKLHVVHDKKTGEVYQYHAHEGQFMDRHDQPISDETHLELGPHLHKAWDQDHSLVT
ncbi:MAG TPA: hypothetical protein VFM18_02285, partial [Methanosarcina sp.]|nr:hypothetical protein [Methanosarcina sp.]